MITMSSYWQRVSALSYPVGLPSQTKWKGFVRDIDGGGDQEAPGECLRLVARGEVRPHGVRTGSTASWESPQSRTSEMVGNGLESVAATVRFEPSSHWTNTGSPAIAMVWE